MSNDDTSPNRRPTLTRRRLLATTTSTMILPAGQTAATSVVSERTTKTDTTPEQSHPKDTAQEYIKALDAGNRPMVNKLIASHGELDQWSRQEFAWVDSFEFEYLGCETVEKHIESVTTDIKLRIAENSDTIRYRFRETKAGWMIWEAIDGLRSMSAHPPETDAKAVAEAYVAALDARNRGAVNELIAAAGELSPWSSQEFDWVSAFEFELVNFDTVRTDDTEVIADIDIAIDDNKETTRYQFRETTAGNIELWAAIGGLRTTGEISPEAAADAYVAALDNGTKKKVNDLIADAGPLDPWSSQDFQWVRAFAIDLVDFDIRRRQDDSAVARLLVRLSDATNPVIYEFRRVDNGWKLWTEIEGIR
ncbi:MAG: hypothetical protein J07HQW1_01331 [Haloquadratum walsbyi J07HQW1]|uniref:Uncharacterized protein n=1 Tax=Haloquadratum walsbyi J07HQW1 TaxID=1238424 RepID=U1PCJ1_9EURY|nr:MAG: hypothetical protein J07HQW1_01331 [Haloquadratum walsbyi J07HQW1]